MSGKYFCISPNGDGTVDIRFEPDVIVRDTAPGTREYDVRRRELRRVTPWGGMVNDLIGRYSEWMNVAEGCGE